MVIYAWRQAVVQSFLALGRDCQCIISVYEIWWSDIFCSGMRRSHSRISYVRLLKQRCLNNCGLYFRFLRVFALPHFRDAPEYLSRRFAEHCDDVVLRNILRRMFEKNEMLFVACDDGPLDQSGVDPIRPDTRLVEVMQCTLVVSGRPAGNAGVQSCNPSD